MDVAYQYLSFFLDEDDELKTIGEVSVFPGRSRVSELAGALFALGLSCWPTAHWTVEGKVYSDVAGVRQRLSRGVHTLS